MLDRIPHCCIRRKRVQYDMPAGSIAIVEAQAPSQVCLWALACLQSPGCERSVLGELCVFGDAWQCDALQQSAAVRSSRCSMRCAS